MDDDLCGDDSRGSTQEVRGNQGKKRKEQDCHSPLLQPGDNRIILRNRRWSIFTRGEMALSSSAAVVIIRSGMREGEEGVQSERSRYGCDVVERGDVQCWIHG